MDALRKLPLFVRIGLMWWVVLFAYPLSRPWLLYLGPFRSGGPAHTVVDWPIVALGGLSLAHALAASWLGVRLMQWRGSGQTVWSLLAWTAAIAWSAVSTWGLVIAAGRLFEPDYSAAERLERFTDIVFLSIALLPWAAWTSFWKVTWILLPLAVVTVLAVRRAHSPTNRAGVPIGSPPA